MAQATGRKSVIVTFKAKDQRPDKAKDKVEIVEASIKSKPHWVDAATMMRGEPSAGFISGNGRL